MGDSVLTSPCSDENQGGVRPSSQRFSNHWLPGNNANPPGKVQASPGFPSCCQPTPSLLFHKITALLSQTQPEPTFQTQGTEDLASQYVVFVFLKSLGIGVAH